MAQFTSIGGFKGEQGRANLNNLDRAWSAGGGLKQLQPSEISFVWPTKEEVRLSTKGYVLGGSIPGHKQQVMEEKIASRFCRFSAPASDARQVCQKKSPISPIKEPYDAHKRALYRP